MEDARAKYGLREHLIQADSEFSLTRLKHKRSREIYICLDSESLKLSNSLVFSPFPLKAKVELKKKHVVILLWPGGDIPYVIRPMTAHIGTPGLNYGTDIIICFVTTSFEFHSHPKLI